jgi:long-chain acyl-CoA synthetase
MINFWARSQPDKTAVDDGVERLSYGELLRRSLRNRSGRRVFFIARNSSAALASLVGLLSSPSTTALIDPLTVSEDLEFQLEDFRPDIVLTDDEVYGRNADVFKKWNVGKVGEWGSEGGGGLGEVVMYYAGIAGRTMQVVHATEGFWRCAHSLATAMQLTPGDVVLVTPPLTHVLGLLTAMAALMSGAAVLLMRRFDVDAAVKLAEKSTVIVGVPTVYAELNKAGVGRLGARYAVSGGAYLPPDVQRRFEEASGVPILQIYGLTEALVLTFQPPQLKDAKGTIGIPLPWVEVKLAEDGELLVKSPWNMKRYGDPAETEKVFQDGYLKTGDIVSMDERGLLYFRGVKKRMIKYKGYPVFPRDLELILLKHPAVKEALVKGEPDPEVGELPVAYVVLRGQASEKELLDFVNSRVAFYKKLRKIYIVDKLP